MSKFIKKHWLATGLSLGASLVALTAVGATFLPLLTTPILAAPAPPPPPLPALPAVVHAKPKFLVSQLSGIASWYGMALAGHHTASGERFQPSEMTAAHRTLPFGTMVRVVDTGTGRSVVVRINDRGVLSEDRVIDLSSAAARDLGILKSGLAKVRLEVLGKKGADQPACTDGDCPAQTAVDTTPAQ